MPQICTTVLLFDDKGKCCLTMHGQLVFYERGKCYFMPDKCYVLIGIG